MNHEIDVLLKLIKNKKGKSLKDFSLSEEEENKIAAKEASHSEDEPDKAKEKEEGLAPKLTSESKVSEDEIRGKEMASRALERLGRKPFSGQKSSIVDFENSIGGEPSPDIESVNPEALTAMIDTKLQERLASGKRMPRSLRDKVQMNIMNMIKNKK